MNLDIAIQNSLKPTMMEGAMKSVVANLGTNYEIQAVPMNAKSAEQTKGKTVAVIDQSSIARPVTQNIATPHYNDKASPLHAPKGLENKPQMNGQGINPIFRRTF